MTQNPTYRISWRDESDLSWYFGPGAAYFEKSTFGTMLEQAVMFGQQTEPCETCNHTGIMDSGAWCDDCDGLGYTRKRVAPRKGNKSKSTTCCRGCAGTGNADRSGSYARDCRRCDGLGYVMPTTVNSKAPSGSEQGWCPEDDVLIRFARVGRRLSRVTEQTFEVLKLFYGDVGTRWASRVQGRLLALYALTPAGAKLAKRGITAEMRKTLGEMGLRLDEAIWNECEAQRDNPEANRAKQLETARQQADELLNSASLEWRTTEVVVRAA